MNTTSEATVGLLIGTSERMHDVASHGPSDRKQARYYPKSALQKLLSMVEPIMRPLTTEMFEHDKEEYHTGSHSIDEVLSNTGQRNAFQLYLRARETPSCSYVKEFQFLCLCREFREWGDKVQYGPYRIRVLANYIYQNFIREGSSASLQISHVIRKNIERTIHDAKTNPSLFEEAYQYVSLAILQQNVVKSFVESQYYHTMWNVDDVDCNLFKALSLGGNTSSHSLRSKHNGAGGSVGSSAASSCASSRSRLSQSRSNFFGEPLSSEVSSPAVSEIQSISSRGTGSSKSSTGSNASAAFDKYYNTKNSQKKSHKKNPAPVVPAKLMEELMPRLQVISIEQNIRLQNYGSLEAGPNGDDTPVVIVNRQPAHMPEKPLQNMDQPVEMTSLDHMTHHALPQTIQLPFQTTQLPSCHQRDRASCQRDPIPSCSRERSHSQHSVEAMLCEESPLQHKPRAPEAWSDTEPRRCAQTQSPNRTQPQQIQIAYTFSDGVCYGKVLFGSHVTLRQFKEIAAWSNCGPNARYFFKRQLPGIGEVHDEITCDDAALPFWAPGTIFARVEKGAD